MKKFNKLVRDKIPQTIINNGDIPVVRTLRDEEFVIELNKKLKEEINEYLADENIEELADIAEVILTLVKAKGISIDEFEIIRKNKLEKRGGFEDKVFLECTK